MSASDRMDYGWIPDPPDQNDFLFSSFEPVEPPQYLPKTVDHTQFHSPVVTQADTGSCVGQSIKYAYEFLHRVYLGEREFTGSALYAYYNARYMGGKTKMVDSGAYIRDGIKGVNRWGLCPETLWPFSTAKVNAKPASTCYAEGNKKELRDYLRAVTLHEIKCALYYMYPVVIGFNTYDTIATTESKKTGLVRVPAKGMSRRGGHAVCLVGYDDYNGRIKFKNSWGSSWGEHGYGYLEYDYIPNHSADYWILRPKLGDNQVNS